MHWQPLAAGAQPLHPTPPHPPGTVCFSLQVFRQCRVVLLLCQRVQLPAVAESVSGRVRRRTLVVSYLPGVSGSALQRSFKCPGLEVFRPRVVRRNALLLRHSLSLVF